MQRVRSVSGLLEGKVSECRAQLFPGLFLLFRLCMQFEGISFSWRQPSGDDHGFEVRQNWPFHSWVFKLGCSLTSLSFSAFIHKIGIHLLYRVVMRVE